MLTAEEIAARRTAIAASPDLAALLATVEARIAPLLRQRPVIPTAKALLSVDGGICPDDAASLLFDPWSADSHRCIKCGAAVRGERHDRHWAKHQHLWLAERTADLATVGVMAERDDAAALAADLLRHYGEHYFEYPARDNVLGPARLFFSTYLESVWLTGMLAAAVLLREDGRLDEATASAVNQLADEAANLIGDFDEGRSNRQTWNDAALMAVAVWFEDEELAQRALEAPSGLVAHLLEGFGPDGLWYEGENYHLFALRGLLLGIDWARDAGVDLIADSALADQLDAALRAPALTALP
ncbi:MAG TPA: alginate lyase family protein, partial [Gemmatimonadales bacterium]|nr:alginate lyase family protein [Gemmatimonadales bacterium]